MKRSDFQATIVSELNSGKRKNPGEFLEYAYSVCRYHPELYETRILKKYHFDGDYYPHALEWMRKMLIKHGFSLYILAYCIENHLTGNIMHWQWKYVQGMGGYIPIDCTVIIVEGDERLLVWVEYDGEEQPLAPLAELSYQTISFYQSYRCDRFLIYTLSGHDYLRNRELKIELRAYNDKCRDDDGDVYFSDHNALYMADNFMHLFHSITKNHQAAILSEDEIDTLLLPMEE